VQALGRSMCGGEGSGSRQFVWQFRDRCRRLLWKLKHSSLDDVHLMRRVWSERSTHPIARHAGKAGALRGAVIVRIRHAAAAG